MSAHATSWARGRAETGAMQLVLYALADRADVAGVTWVGQERLASDCSSGERTVRRSLAALEHHALIGRYKRYDARGRRTSDVVVLGAYEDDRAPMLPFAEHAGSGRYPDEIACLLAKLAGRDPLMANLAGSGGLPARSEAAYRPDSTEPTGQIRPNLPADLAREAVAVEAVVEAKEEAWAAGGAAASPGARNAEDARAARFQQWRAAHPTPPLIEAWRSFVDQDDEIASDGDPRGGDRS